MKVNTGGAHMIKATLEKKNIVDAICKQRSRQQQKIEHTTIKENNPHIVKGKEHPRWQGLQSRTKKTQ